MIPSKYEINVAKTMYPNAIRPSYFWFCNIDAGTREDHAKQVYEFVKSAFPAPGYQITLHQRYEYTKCVNEFDLDA